MKSKKLLLLCSLLIGGNLFSQARMVLNDNVFLVISNSAKVVLENPNANALATAGGGGNIISEGENNQIIWDIGSSTGNYVIPWTTRPVSQGGNGVKIPMGMNLTSAGDAGGFFVFSTYETATDLNTAYPTYPTAVTTMENDFVDASLFVVDRFWILDNENYTTKPDAILSFNYDDNANEIAGTNTLAEANLQAQRWNIDETSWESLLFGVTNTATNVTNNVVALAADFWPVWILVDQTVPLPVVLNYQKVENSNCINTIKWETASEENCSHYSIMKSYDGAHWEKIAQIPGAGTSSFVQNYEFQDGDVDVNGFIYYQIVQYDFDGKATKFEKIGKNSFCDENYNPIIYPNPAQDELVVKTNKQGVIRVYDKTGRLVKDVSINELNTHLDISSLASGVYTVSVETASGTYNQKIIKTVK